jgi:hypothetical protein
MGIQYDGALTYIHKVKNGRNIYFFANSSDKPIDTKVTFRGNQNLETWNPHTGDQQKTELAQTDIDGQPATTIKLTLAPISSVFYIQQ